MRAAIFSVSQDRNCVRTLRNSNEYGSIIINICIPTIEPGIIIPQVVSTGAYTIFNLTRAIMIFAINKNVGFIMYTYSYREINLIRL